MFAGVLGVCVLCEHVSMCECTYDEIIDTVCLAQCKRIVQICVLVCLCVFLCHL